MISSSNQQISRASKVLASFREKKKTIQFNSSKTFEIQKNLLDIEKQLEILKKKKILKETNYSSSKQINQVDNVYYKPHKEQKIDESTHNEVRTGMTSNKQSKKLTKKQKNLTVSSKHPTKTKKMEKNFNKVLNGNLKRFSNQRQTLISSKRDNFINFSNYKGRQSVQTCSSFANPIKKNLQEEFIFF